MWTLWNKPMAYDKAKWWANRVTAGYGGWRLPTAEEALSLLQMERAQYAGLAGFRRLDRRYRSATSRARSGC